MSKTNQYQKLTWYLTCGYHKLQEGNGKALLAVRFLFNESPFLSVKMKPYTSMPSWSWIKEIENLKYDLNLRIACSSFYVYFRAQDNVIERAHILEFKSMQFFCAIDRFQDICTWTSVSKWKLQQHVYVICSNNILYDRIIHLSLMTEIVLNLGM